MEKNLITPYIESAEDIVSEMRERAWKQTTDEMFAKVLESYADRIEAASKRDARKIYESAYSDGWNEALHEESISDYEM